MGIEVNGPNLEYQKSQAEVVAGTNRKFDSIESQGITAEGYEQMAQVKNRFESLRQATE